MEVVVTGGAGFIGSNLVDALIKKGHTVKIIDNLSSGSYDNVNKKAEFINCDIRDDVSRHLDNVDSVFHFAADPDVRSSALAPEISFEMNVRGTFSLLESCRKAEVKRFVLASTSTVYGEADQIPTLEDYPCTPISNYGASKLACEGYVASYAYSYGIRSTTLRLANIFGERSLHGVMFDFFKKLKSNQLELEILGDGKQDKSYLYITDCLDAIITSHEKQRKVYDVVNIGSRSKIAVDQVAGYVCRAMGVTPKFKYTGTKSGWIGDVRLMLLDTHKLEKLGWKEKVTVEDGINRYMDWLSKAV